MTDARILLFDDPTRAINADGRRAIHDRMYHIAEAGGTILFASGDLAEVIGVADRIVVMAEGRVTGIVARADATPDRLLQLALPGGDDAAARREETV